MRRKIFFAFLFIAFFYTRFVGLSWGLPYPMHPDERNMAVAIQGLNCKDVTQVQDCFNPHFFAYGQPPLYLAYGGIMIIHAVLNQSQEISFVEATLALRIISALASLITAFMLYQLAKMLIDTLLQGKKTAFLKRYGPYAAVISFLFSPYGVQFSHFGTTESLLMLLFTTIIYLSVLVKEHPENKKYSYLLSFSLGLSIAIKISSLIFLAVPLGVLFIYFLQHNSKRTLIINTQIKVLALTGICAVIFSPQTIISWNEFMGSFAYESSVATGSYPAFYTRQFVHTLPVFFQFTKIFPYTLGMLSFILALLGFLFLPWKNSRLNILRYGLLIYFLPTSFLFAKWTRFMAPVFPLFTLFASLFMLQLMYMAKKRALQIALVLLFFCSLVPGIAYVSIYQLPDIRFRVSEWIYNHIPAQSKILSETANVIDIPIPPPGYEKIPPNYQYVSFDFYHLDEDPTLQAQLDHLEKTADYIFIPSRRVFMNHPGSSYPQLQTYYKMLFSGLDYRIVRKFTSYPHISLFGKIILNYPDEQAEETWTVFDHPVIRIYQRGVNDDELVANLRNYKTTNYTIENTTYHLLVADNLQKWEQGLMGVRSKEDIGGKDGMIFLFPEKEVKIFWNKNTVTDLSIYWIDGQTVVGTTQLPSIEKSKQIVTVTSPVQVDKVIEIVR